MNNKMSLKTEITKDNIFDYLIFVHNTKSKIAKNMAIKKLCKFDEKFDAFFNPQDFLKENDFACEFNNSFFLRQNKFCEIMEQYSVIMENLNFSKSTNFELYKTRISKTPNVKKIENYFAMRNFTKANCDFIDYAKSWKRNYDKQAIFFKQPVCTVDDEFSQMLKTNKVKI